MAESTIDTTKHHHQPPARVQMAILTGATPRAVETAIIHRTLPALSRQTGIDAAALVMLGNRWGCHRS